MQSGSPAVQHGSSRGRAEAESELSQAAKHGDDEVMLMITITSPPPSFSPS